MGEAYNKVENNIIGIIKTGEESQVGDMCQVCQKADIGQEIALPCIICWYRCRSQSTCRRRIEVKETDSRII